MHGKRALEMLILAPSIIPGIVVGVSVGQVLLTLGIAYTIIGVILVQTIGTLPLMIRLMTASFETLPDELIHAARSLGAGPVAILRHLILPLAVPGLLAGRAPVLRRLLRGVRQDLRHRRAGYPDAADQALHLSRSLLTPVPAGRHRLAHPAAAGARGVHRRWPHHARRSHGRRHGQTLKAWPEILLGAGIWPRALRFRCSRTGRSPPLRFSNSSPPA